MRRLVLLACLLSSASTLGQPTDAPMRAQPALVSEPSPEELEKTLLALGASLGRDLRPLALSPEELAQVVRGLESAAGAAPPSTPEVSDLLERLKRLEVARRGRAQANERERGRAYAASAARAPGARVFTSGLVFIPVEEGSGATPLSVDTVRVHYRGRLIDGTEFDSSYGRGQPAEFRLSQVIACWTEGVQKLRPGGRAKLVCPPSIAYGDRGAPPKIPPGATLVFDVELKEVLQRGSTTVR